MRNYIPSLLFSGLLAIVLVSFRPVSGLQATAFQVSWGKVGESTAEPTESGTTTLSASAGKPLKAIKLKVLRGGLNLHKCEIWFQNGSKKLVELRNEVSAGNESREISLPENTDEVNKVIFWYDTRNYGNQKASLELWGKKFDN